MEFSEKRVLVVGMGKSGMAVCRKLKSLGASIYAVDSATSPMLEEKATLLEKEGIKTKLGEHLPEDLEGIDIVVVSPGVPDKISFLEEARRRKIPVISEVELASYFTQLPIIGVTGTNGKTTTTYLIGEIFKEAGKPAVVAGNIGYPLIEAIDKAYEGSFLVVELSSFQLKNTFTFHPYVSVFLNIDEDHLDWHVDFNDYLLAKSKIFANQAERDYAVVNYDDVRVRTLIPSIKAKVVPFSKHTKLEGGVCVREGKIVSFIEDRKEICEVNELKIRGEHNLENAMAAVAVALICEIAPENIRKTLLKFRGLEHRLEFVREIRGVNYYNDSKATNPHATIKALTAFDAPIILLVGGRNKGVNFYYLAREAKKKIKAAVAFGEAKEELRDAFESVGGIAVYTASTVDEAVGVAYRISSKGDVVLFSPACASFDAFNSYEERGKAFKVAVKNLLLNKERNKERASGCKKR